MDPELEALFEKGLETEAQFQALVNRIDAEFDTLIPDEKKRRRLSGSYVVKGEKHHILVMSYEKNDSASHCQVIHYPSREYGNGYGVFVRAVYECKSKIINPERPTQDYSIMMTLTRIEGEVQKMRREIGFLRSREPSPPYVPPEEE